MKRLRLQAAIHHAKSFGIFPAVLLIVQGICAVRVIARLIGTRQGVSVQPVSDNAGTPAAITVLLPVLNEETRLTPCLNGLMQQGACVAEIVVIDGGSSDDTQAIVACAAQRDRRVRLLVAPAPPTELNGKAWQLAYGAARIDEPTDWLLTIDADVRPGPDLVASLMAHAAACDVPALSVATRQRLPGAAAGLLHPSMLSTLVYRFGIPGHATNRVDRVQANGQCMLIRWSLLDAVGGFGAVTGSLNEDVTLARLTARHGAPVGFYEAGALASVEMYASARETWRNWPRSLPLRDAMTRWSSLLGLAEVTAVQALPPVIALVSARRRGWNDPLTSLNLALIATRLGVLAGTARAYEDRLWTYWLSPVCDLAVAVRLWQSAFQRTQRWRGRDITRGAAS